MAAKSIHGSCRSAGGGVVTQAPCAGPIVGRGAGLTGCPQAVAAACSTPGSRRQRTSRAPRSARHFVVGPSVAAAADRPQGRPHAGPPPARRSANLFEHDSRTAGRHGRTPRGAALESAPDAWSKPSTIPSWAVGLTGALIGDHRNDYECHSAPRSIGRAFYRNPGLFAYFRSRTAALFALPPSPSRRAIRRASARSSAPTLQRRESLTKQSSLQSVTATLNLNTALRPMGSSLRSRTTSPNTSTNSG